MKLHQVSVKRVEVRKVPRGVQPFFELKLDDDHRIVGVKNHFLRDFTNRATVDHIIDLWVEVEL